MSEKRFYIKCDECNAWSVWEKDKDVVVFDLLKYDAEVVCKALNELHNENEQLKSFVEYEKRQHKHWKRECLENIKEIAQLKREIVQLKGDRMTENKQFIFVIDNGEPTFYDLSKKEIMNMNETEEMLNTINNENEQLKSFKEQNIKEYTKLKKVCNECKKENEQLKQENKKLADALTVYFQSKIKGDVE